MMAGTVYNSQYKEATRMSIGGGTDKGDVVHLYKGLSLSHQKECEVMPFVATWMDLEICHPERSESDREGGISYESIYIKYTQ